MSATMLPETSPDVLASPAPASATPGSATFEPVILGFTCNWCSYRAADLAGTARTKYPPNVRLIRFMCSGRLDPTFVLRALADGADGVILTGCWPADCHYRIQNVKALRRFLLLRRVLVQLGIEPERLQRFYASAAEGKQLADEFARIVEQIRALGPLHWNGHVPAAIALPDEPVEAPEPDRRPPGESDLQPPGEPVVEFVLAPRMQAAAVPEAVAS